MMRAQCVVLGLVLGVGAGAGRAHAQAGMMREQRRDPAYEATLRAIAQDIEDLKSEYPQLADFSVERHFNAPHLRIAYEYRVGPRPRTGGWTSGMSSPKDDGVVLYVDFHDPKSNHEVHTQPRVPLYRFGDRAVMLLMLEGTATRSLRRAIVGIFEAHHVRSVPMDWRGDPVEP